MDEGLRPGDEFLTVSFVCCSFAVLVSEFESKDDLIDALLASQFIPGWTDGECMSEAEYM